MDLLICFVQVQCEIGLLVGELLIIRGYLLLVFVKLLVLVECVGNGVKGCGLIIVFYIVLIEGDDLQDLIVDVVCVIFDGYILFLCCVVDSGLYLVIDVELLVSCVVMEIVDELWCLCICKLKWLVLVYLVNWDLIVIGVYQCGNDVVIDEVLECWLEIMEFFGQDVVKVVDFLYSQVVLQCLVE